MPNKPSAKCRASKASLAGLALGVALTLALVGCGGRAQRGQQGSSSDFGGSGRQAQNGPQASQANPVRTAQEKALATARGGTPNVAIPWSEVRSDIQGALTWDQTVTLTYNCRQYRQTMSIAGELLTGTLTACPMGDGTWKLVEPRQ